MKKHLLLQILGILFLSRIATTISAQDPVVQWDNTIGGNSYDVLGDACSTSDSGYLLGGYSRSSVSGDKTEGILGGTSYYDFWVVKVDSDGNIQWQNTIGSDLSDYLTSVIETSDHNYLIGGYTSGGISADKNEPCLGGNDYWILKLDSAGNILWQNTIGGNGSDMLRNVLELPNGDFLLCGSSTSDISGDKTESAYGLTDGWAVEISGDGTLIRQKSFGGAGFDEIEHAIVTNDGNYVLAAYSTSGISGNKMDTCRGGYDYWLIKIDSNLNIIWQKTYGGELNDQLSTVVELANGELMLGGDSDSNNKGDKSELSFNEGHYDDFDYDITNSESYWIIKTDATGNLIWENTIGGYTDFYGEHVADLIPYGDNRILIAGYSGYYGGGGDITDSEWGVDEWLVAIDTNGYIIWQNALNGDIEFNDYEPEYLDQGFSYVKAAIATDDGFLIAGYSDADAGNDKTENTISGGLYDNDFWIVKLGKDTCTGSPIYADLDQDGSGAGYLASACEFTNGPWSSNNNDCDDYRSSVYGGATEICDGFDNDCDGLIDNGYGLCNPGPAIQWDANIGTPDYDFLASITASSDGGFVFAGYPSASEYNDYLIDYNIYKLNSSGTLEWQKQYLAGGYDEIKCIRPTTDNGYIIGGNSSSGISGDKTEACYGSEDIWIIKTDAAGNIQWQNTIGGSSTDNISAIYQTADGGYMVAATSYSGISGEKTTVAYGGADYWVLKLDATGNILWQQTLGGNGWDYAADIQQTPDGGFVVGGYSISGISGNKTVGTKGSYDYWIVKLNSAGTIIWNRDYGGSAYESLGSVAVDTDGNIILTGDSESGISGDKSEPNMGTGFTSDYWIVKINHLGAIIWDNTIGSNSRDEAKCSVILPDNSLLIGGISSSGISTDKSEPAVKMLWGAGYMEHSYAYDYWLLRIEPSGNMLWQNTIGGNMEEADPAIALTADGEIALAGTSYSFHQSDKSQNNLDTVEELITVDEIEGDELDYLLSGDFWIVKLGNYCAGLPELCNGYDDNCNGLVDEGALVTGYYDADLDGFGDPDSIIHACPFPAGYSLNNLDCNDADPLINPAAVELCNNLDENCNLLIDDGLTFIYYYQDEDADLYGNPEIDSLSCLPVMGFVADHTDCNDLNALINAGQPELCNQLDDNCNYLIDDGLVFNNWYADNDGDFYGNALIDSLWCAPLPGYVLNATDCNDLDALINPLTPEICNNADDNCNFIIDDGLIFIDYYEDLDADLFGNALVDSLSCLPLTGFVSDPTDCNDSDPAINPAQPEICNNTDDNCNFLIDDGLIFTTWYADNDDDLFGDITMDSVSCLPVSGFILNDADCNDADPVINPDNPEICNNADDNCNTLIDDGLTFITYYADEDMDAFGNINTDSTACAPVAGYVENNLDCNDTDAGINPSVPEICNNADENCNGETDEGLAFVQYYQDADIDGFGNENADSLWCADLIGYVTDSTDCDDNNAFIFPGAPEIMNGVDDNCNDQIDEDLEISTSENTFFEIYPNPATELIVISTTQSDLNEVFLLIMDVTGNLIANIPFTGTGQQVNISYLPAGIYFIKLDNGTHSTMEKFVKQ